MNTNFQVIGLTRFGIEPESAASKTDALTTMSTELLKSLYSYHQFNVIAENHTDCCLTALSPTADESAQPYFGLARKLDLIPCKKIKQRHQLVPAAVFALVDAANCNSGISNPRRRNTASIK